MMMMMMMMMMMTMMILWDSDLKKIRSGLVLTRQSQKINLE